MPIQRTTIVLPFELRQKVFAAAQKRGVSFGEFVRQALKQATAGNGNPSKREDPLLQDESVFRGRVPKDVSKNHDFYLYGERWSS
jgi:hypothetical protein